METGTLSGNATVANSYGGYTGAGYVVIGADVGDAVTFPVESLATSPGFVMPIGVRFAAGGAEEGLTRVLTVDVDGTEYSAVAFPTLTVGMNAGWDVYRALRFSIPVNPGINMVTIRNADNFDIGGVNLDGYLYNPCPTSTNESPTLGSISQQFRAAGTDARVEIPNLADAESSTFQIEVVGWPEDPDLSITIVGDSIVIEGDPGPSGTTSQVQVIVTDTDPNAPRKVSTEFELVSTRYSRAADFGDQRSDVRPD